MGEGFLPICLLLFILCFSSSSSAYDIFKCHGLSNGTFSFPAQSFNLVASVRSIERSLRLADNCGRISFENSSESTDLVVHTIPPYLFPIYEFNMCWKMDLKKDFSICQQFYQKPSWFLLVECAQNDFFAVAGTSDPDVNGDQISTVLKKWLAEIRADEILDFKKFEIVPEECLRTRSRHFWFVCVLCGLSGVIVSMLFVKYVVYFINCLLSR